MALAWPGVLESRKPMPLQGKPKAGAFGASRASLEPGPGMGELAFPAILETEWHAKRVDAGGKDIKGGPFSLSFPKKLSAEN
jgi:hypothetical protein